MWAAFVQHESIDEIMRDRGLAKTGDALVNLCYSLAKTLVLGFPVGEKVRDRVLARAIRNSPLAAHLRHRSDPGDAADSFEAIVAYLWMSGKETIESIVSHLAANLQLSPGMSRKLEAEMAVNAFRLFLEDALHSLPSTTSQSVE